MGFGFSLFSVPLLVMLLPASRVVPLLAGLSLVVNAAVLYQTRSHLRPRRILPLILAGLAGVPLGVRLLAVASESTLRVGLGGATVVLSSALLFGVRFRVKREALAMVPVGLLSGVMNGAATLSGPPVVIFQIAQRAGKDLFRATLAGYFLALTVLTIPVLWLNGLVDGELALAALYLLPGVLVGLALGLALSRKLDSDRFRKTALVLVMLLGLMAIFTGRS